MAMGKNVFTFLYILVSAVPIAVPVLHAGNLLTIWASVNLKTSGFWEVMLRNLLENYQSFGLNLEEGSSWSFRNW